MRFPTPHAFRIFFYMHSVPFTRGVLLKQSSLGGSESACRVTAEALARRGHDVHIFASQLLPDVPDEAEKQTFLSRLFDDTGVMWHSAEVLPEVFRFEQPDVFISLRMSDVFALNNQAKLRILWNQDLLVDNGALGPLYNVDRLAFVSEYQEKQWCDLHPMLRPLSWVVPNPIDPYDVQYAVKKTEDSPIEIVSVVDVEEKIPNRFIHISRPERGLDGVLAMWPKIRQRIPDATLAICRYSSMYDPGGFGRVCAMYDQKVQVVNDKVGGITYLGELNKRQLYVEIARSVAMIYPTTQKDFAETNCIACTEAQLCGTPFIGSWRGALPETLAPGAGILIDGDILKDKAVLEQWVSVACAVAAAHQDVDARIAADGVDYGPYESLRLAGFARARLVTGDNAAALWEQRIRAFFEDRYEAHKNAILRQLLHWDNHAPALLVTNDIIANSPAYPPNHEPGGGPIDNKAVWGYREAVDAEKLCARVIRQEEQTAAHYAQYAVQDPAAEAENNSRLAIAAEAILTTIKDVKHPLVLDVACGNGSLALLLLRNHPTVRVLGVDYSDGVLALARAACAKEGFAARAEFQQMDIMARLNDLAGTNADAVFCGEFLEHVERPWVLIDGLEAACRGAHARVVLTTPCGPFAELLTRGIPRQRGHVHAFSLRDLSTMYEHKANFAWRYLSIGISPRGTACGYWIMSFAPGGGPAQPLDYEHTVLTERPYQRIVASMIVRDESAWLQGCLDALYHVVDRVVIYDTGSTDGSREIAAAWGAEVICGEWPDHFAEARNRALAAVDGQCEWVLWVDADERLTGAEHLRRYASDGGPYLGYVLHQCHLMLDSPMFHDVPVRLFRAGRGIQFYGDVHEQPETTRDEGMTPALNQSDFKLIHHGYPTMAVRKQKLLGRNLRLLMRAIKSGDCRELDYVLYMRDLVNIAMFDRDDHGGKLTVNAYKHLVKATQVFHEKFADPTHRCHQQAWPFYQQAIEALGTGIEVRWGFLAGRGRLEGRNPTGETFFAQTEDEVERIVDYKTKGWLKGMRGVTIDVTPAVTREDGHDRQSGRVLRLIASAAEAVS